MSLEVEVSCIWEELICQKPILDRIIYVRGMYLALDIFFPSANIIRLLANHKWVSWICLH